jgi:NAD(P)H-hydrate epimerase
MREIDRIAMNDFNLGILQMMENAGRSLAQIVMEVNVERSHVLVAAGSGGNGGGGLCAARHLHNHGQQVAILLTRPPGELTGAAASQLAVLQSAGVTVIPEEDISDALAQAGTIVDALIGYSLSGPPTGRTADLIGQINAAGCPVLSLDLPSGLDATTGSAPGVSIRARRTLTLALPKPGLTTPSAGQLFLADIGIPPEVYLRLGIRLPSFWGRYHILPLQRV